MNRKIIKNITLGTDPEMFLYSNTLNKFVPVCGLVGGTKEEPLMISEKGHALQEDNVLLEFCVPPSKTCEEFIDNIEFVKNYINEIVLSKLGLVAKCIPSGEFDIQDLQTKQAQHFGCTPDYNAWTHEENSVGESIPTLRTAGGHGHCGYEDHDPQTSIELVRIFDLFLGVSSVLLDSDTRRREKYGCAGAYRLKHAYGFEYRVLSNFWIESPKLMKWFWDTTMLAIEYYNRGEQIYNPRTIVDCINKGDRRAALEILDEYNINIPLVEELSLQGTNN